MVTVTITQHSPTTRTFLVIAESSELMVCEQRYSVRSAEQWPTAEPKIIAGICQTYGIDPETAGRELEIIRDMQSAE